MRVGRDRFLDTSLSFTEDNLYKILIHLGIPRFVASRTCLEVNGYFGNKATYAEHNLSGQSYITSYSTILIPQSCLARARADRCSNLVPMSDQDG